MSVFKNVYFHELNVYKRILTKGNKKDAPTILKQWIIKKDIDLLFDDIILNKLTNNSITVKIEDDEFTFEVIKYDKDFIFARIGRFKDIKNVHLRDRKTLVSSQISKTTSQDLEIFTYMLIDRSNYLISYLKEQSAPAIQNFSNLIGFLYGSSKMFFGEVSSIIIEDAIEILKTKSTIGTISYKLSLPSEELLGLNGVGLTEADFSTLQNQKSVDIEVKMVAERGKNTVEDPSKLEGIIRKIMKKTKKVTVKAQNEGEYMQSYNIVDTILTKKEKFDFDKDAVNFNDEIYNKLKSTYVSNKLEIISNIKEE